MNSKNYAAAYYQTSEELVPDFQTKNNKELSRDFIASFIKKLLKIKKLKTIPWPLKKFAVAYYQTYKEVF